MSSARDEPTARFVEIRRRTEADLPDLDELAMFSSRLETAPASGIVKWAHERFGDDLVLAASFQDCVLIDITARVAPDIEVVFLDTQYHFAETMWYVDLVRRRYDLNLRVMRPRIDPDDLWQVDVEKCCHLRKVEPLERAIKGRSAWMTGLRRREAFSREEASIVSWDERRSLIKVNPLANWTDADVESYIRDHDLPSHPLMDRGYASIGCWPCTEPAGSSDPRAGRWPGMDKVECGLH